MDEWQFAAPTEGIGSGHLEVRGGAVRLDLYGDPAMAGLCRARFAGNEPEVRAQGGQVTVDYGHLGLFDWIEDVLFDGPRAAQIALNAHIPWTVELRGGASMVDADLSALRVGAVEVRGGVSSVALSMGQPNGAVPIRIRGGASKLTVCRPEGVATRVRIRGGASAVVLDGQRFGAMGGVQELTSPGFDVAPDRYEIQIDGGASKLAVISQRTEVQAA